MSESVPFFVIRWNKWFINIFLPSNYLQVLQDNAMYFENKMIHWSHNVAKIKLNLSSCIFLKNTKKASIRNHVNLRKERQNISAGSIKKHFLSKKVYSDLKLKTWQGQMGIVVVLPALLVTFWAGELNFLEGTKSFLWHFHEPLC